MKTEEKKHIEFLTNELTSVKSKLQLANNKIGLIEKTKVWKANRQIVEIILIFNTPLPFRKKTQLLLKRIYYLFYYLIKISVFPVTYILNKKIFIENRRTSEKKNYNNWIKLVETNQINPNIKTYVSPNLCIIPIGNINILSLKESLNDNKIPLAYNNSKKALQDISETSIKANNTINKNLLESISSDYILILPENYSLAKNFMLRFSYYFNLFPNSSLYYFDEDEIENNIRKHPKFKPDFCPDNLISSNYIGNCFIIKKDCITSSEDGFNPFDLLLQILNQPRNKITHIPEILIHKTMDNNNLDRQKSIQKYFEKNNQTIKIESTFNNLYQIRYITNENPKISIIIPSKDKSSLLRNCINSILEKTTYTNYEIIIINNNSLSSEFKSLIREYNEKYKGLVFVFNYVKEFNFSKIINFATKHATGSYYLFLNNDTEVITNDWLERLVENASRKDIGSVGGKLLYRNKTIQHAGVLIGVAGDAAIHAMANYNATNKAYFNILNTPSNYSAVTGACLMCSAEKFNSVNGFNEDLTIEFNDIDFCLKLMEKGLYNLYLPSVELYHFESKSRGNPHSYEESIKKHNKELKLFQEKWGKIIINDPFFNPNLCKLHNDFRVSVEI